MGRRIVEVETPDGARHIGRLRPTPSQHHRPPSTPTTESPGPLARRRPTATPMPVPIAEGMSR